MTTETPASDLETRIEAAEKPAQASEPGKAGDDTPSGDTGSDGKDQQPHRDRKAERRIARLNAKLAREREQNAELAKRVETVESKLAEQATPELTRPNREDFESLEEYEDALLEYGHKKAEAERPPSEQPSETKADDEARSRRFMDFASTAGAKDPEFAKVLEKAAFNCSNEMLDGMMDLGTEEGAEVFKFLDANRAEADRIAALSPASQAAELEKIADNLDAGGTPPRTPAPDEPIEPETGTDSPSVDLDKLDDKGAVTHDLKYLKRRRAGIGG